MSHWTDQCIGAFLPTTGYYEKHRGYVPFVDITESTSVFSMVPYKQTTDRPCASCGTVFNSSTQIQHHKVYRPKTGKNKDKLLWKHSGWIKTGTSETPSIHNSTNECLARFKQDKLTFIVSFFHHGMRTVTSTKDNVQEHLQTYKFNDLYIADFAAQNNDFYIWQPTQYELVTNKENMAISALEKL